MNDATRPDQRKLKDLLQRAGDAQANAKRVAQDSLAARIEMQAASQHTADIVEEQTGDRGVGDSNPPDQSE